MPARNGFLKKCLNCEKDFYVNPGQLRQGRGKFCCKKCGYDYRKKVVSPKKGKKYPNNVRAEKRNCRNCGKEFYATKDHNGKLGGKCSRAKQVYCSHSCYVKGNRVSKFEDMVYEYLSSMFNNIKRQVKRGRWSFDMAVDKTNILIEADGSYWHSLEKQKEVDSRKNNWVKQNGHELYRIDELEFYKNKKTSCQVIIDRMKKLDPQLEIVKI